MIEALVRWVQTTPAEMCESLKWDQGSEMAHWEVLTNEWGCPSTSVILAHRGRASEGRTRTPTDSRGLVPKGTDLRAHSQADYDVRRPQRPSPPPIRPSISRRTLRCRPRVQ